MIKFLDLPGQYSSIKGEIDAALAQVIEEGAFIGGRFVKQFEKAFGEYLGAQHVIGVGNGTDALEIAIDALDLPEGSEILVPGNSFIASSEAVTRTGHKVVFVDIDPSNYSISVDDIRKKVGANTSAIMAVHLYGHPADMDSILEICRSHDLKLIEDCAQAHGAKYKGRKIGTIGDVSAFSFYPGKNLGAYGDAGAIATNDPDLEKRARMIANHGRIEKYDHLLEGRNSRLDGIQAAVLSVKLKHLDSWSSQRVHIAEIYSKHLAGIEEITVPATSSWASPVYHLYVIRVDDRDDLKAALQENGIQTGIHYPVALPKLRAYEYLNQADPAMLCNSYDTKLLSLPIGEHMRDEDAYEVIDAISKYYSRAAAKSA